jgi:hypothetical protein
MFRDMNMGRKKGISGKNAFPLRNVMDRFTKETEYGLTLSYERLECGHEIRTPKDFIGETFALRRRCKYCAK